MTASSGVRYARPMSAEANIPEMTTESSGEKLSMWKLNEAA
jgi:hypothetical protein